MNNETTRTAEPAVLVWKGNQMPKDYCYETDESQLLKSLVLTSDPHRLNWVEGAGTFGEVTAPKGLETARRIEADDNGATTYHRYDADHSRRQRQ